MSSPVHTLKGKNTLCLLVIVSKIVLICISLIITHLQCIDYHPSVCCLFFTVMQEELSCLFEKLSAGVGDDMTSEARGKSSNASLLVMDPIRLIELLQICTFIVQGQQHSCFCLWILTDQNIMWSLKWSLSV